MYQSRLELAIDSRSGEQSLQRVERGLRGVERAGDKTSESVGNVSTRLDKMERFAKAAGGALLGMSAGTGVLLAMGRQASQTAAEIQKLSRIAGTSTGEFQRLAYGAAQYGVEQGKLADIIRDTQDRIGDFLQTGAGEFVDFFEQIAPKANLSAEALARMSGPDALQAVYSALENAGLSASEMTFYMEALASDATELIPLLRDSGAEVNRLGREADELNAVLSDLELQRLKDIRNEFHQLEQQLSTETARAVSQFDELMKSSLEGISSGVNQLARGFNAFMDDFRSVEAKRSIAGIDEELNALFDTKARLEGRIELFGKDSPQSQDAIRALEELKTRYDELIERKKELQNGGPSFSEPEILSLSRASIEFKTLDHWLFDVGETSAATSSAIANTTSELDKQANAARGLVDELYPLQAAQREYAEEKAQLVQYALQEGKSNEWLEESMRRLEESYSSNQSAVETYGLEVDNLAGRADPMASSFEEAANRIDETFADAFAGAFDSFDDFASQLEDGFKRLLAELAYQATLRPIVVGFTQDMQGMMGIGGAQAQGLSGTSGGFDSLLSTGKQLYNGFANGFGNIAWGGASNTAYAGTGFANSATSGIGQSGFMGGSTANFSGMTGLASAGAGYLGGKAGQAVWGDDRANSNYGQMAGAAIGTYFGGSIGAGIGSFLGSGVDQLFGSDRDSYGQIGQELDAEVDAHGVYRYDRLDKYQNYARDSAFGTIGITKKQKTDDDALKRMVKQFVEIDNAVAAVMNASQLEETQQALDGWKSSRTEDIGSIVGQRLNAVASAADTPFTASLKRLSGEDLVQGLIGGLQIENVGAEMARAVAQDMNSEFRDALRGGDDIGAATQSIMTAANAVNLMADSAGRLGLEFDATATGALAAADDLQALAGGVGSLSSQQQAYYQAFFSDQEQFAQAAENLGERFDDLNLSMPDTAADFRDLVEAQNLMSEAGREQYASLMQLVPSMSQYLDVMERQHSQLQGWIDSLLLSDQSTLNPSERLQTSQSQYASLLVQAENGDAQAMGDLGNVAQQYLQEAASYYGQASDQYGGIFDEILDAARGLGVEVDGSHAQGLGTVPFDGYRAELHQGETVLPAPIAKLYRESAPTGQRDGELLRELQAMRREAEALRNEVRQLRGERGQDADRAAAQRDRQLREQRDISRNTRTPVATV